MDYADRHVLESLIYLPMIAVVVLLLVPGRHREVVRYVGVTTGLLLLVGSVYVFWSFDPNSEALYQLQRTYSWLSAAWHRPATGRRRHWRADGAADGHRLRDRRHHRA